MTPRLFCVSAAFWSALARCFLAAVRSPAFLNLHGPCVQVGNRIVREHGGCYLEWMVELFASRLATFCDPVNFLQAQQLRTCLDNLFGLFKIESAHGIVDRVIWMAQSRITFFQYVFIGLRTCQLGRFDVLSCLYPTWNHPSVSRYRLSSPMKMPR